LLAAAAAAAEAALGQLLLEPMARPQQAPIQDRQAAKAIPEWVAQAAAQVAE
jgi:hypothetical protein